MRKPDHVHRYINGDTKTAKNLVLLVFAFNSSFVHAADPSER